MAKAGGVGADGGEVEAIFRHQSSVLRLTLRQPSLLNPSFTAQPARRSEVMNFVRKDLSDFDGRHWRPECCDGHNPALDGLIALKKQTPASAHSRGSLEDESLDRNLPFGWQKHTLPFPNFQ